MKTEILKQLEKELEIAIEHQYDNEESEGYLVGISKAIEVVKNLDMPAVSGQRELLLAYFGWHRKMYYVTNKDSDIDEFFCQQ